MIHDLELCKEEYENKINSLLSTYIKQHRRKEIPQSYETLTQSYLSIMARSRIICSQGFALLTSEWIDLLVKWIGNKKCLEIMAGCGSLSYCLKHRGVDIIATDNFSWSNGCRVKWDQYWTNIENIDAIEAIEKYSDRDIIIMSWPYMDNCAYESLLKMRKTNPNAQMIYIGEPRGGCTSSDNFFEVIEYVNDHSFLEINQKFPKWNGIHDQIYLIK